MLTLHKTIERTPVNNMLYELSAWRASFLLYRAGSCVSWGVHYRCHLLQEALLVKVLSSRVPQIGPRGKPLSVVLTALPSSRP